MDKINLHNTGRALARRLTVVLLLGGILAADSAVIAWSAAIVSGWELAAGVLGYALISAGLLMTALVLG